ncbi:MAG: CRISPR-associated endonuclease Cas3'' [Gammaproteobacteria bacterium]|nr:CRISPR-associated endonuclease Cas3'' [Gammaproteobacteria bacterium]
MNSDRNTAPTAPIARYTTGSDGPLAQPLPDHLRGVSERSAMFASAFGAAELARLGGLWHDLGKYAPDWQRFIREACGVDQSNAEDAHLEDDHPRRKGPDHSAAGALHALASIGPVGPVLAQIIAAHHSGLYNGFDLQQRLSKAEAPEHLSRALAGGVDAAILDAHQGRPPAFTLAPCTDPTPGNYAFWVRMLFSCLIDADRLDSEAFGSGIKASQLRTSFPTLDRLLPDFNQFMSRFAADTPVKRLRADVLADCRRAAGDAQGLFTLTVPTGSGKTLASLGFALEHAARHGLKRVIYVIPYTSIIEQTADVFRSISSAFADAVIEHHSNAEDNGDDQASERQGERLKLATENWDAPVIVTTGVQFFESLFAAKTSRCRKLHNVCESVVVLDEAQLLPPPFLQPIVDALNLLSRHYKTTVVLSTATQPALASSARFGSRFRGLDTPREIIADVDRLYRGLKRVEVHLPADTTRRSSWADIAERMSANDDVLAIVSRRADARALWQLLPSGAIHLSALMCGAHRSDVIARIKQALSARRANPDLLPVRVVATPLVECGVDIDLPVVYRQFAGLDSIAQAAGRCNREGLLDKGVVHVFFGEKDAPRGSLRMAESAAREVLHGHTGDALDRKLFERYFALFYNAQDRDAKKIVEKLEIDTDTGYVKNLRDAADTFKLIDNDETGYQSVYVPYQRCIGDDNFEKLITLLRRDGPERWLLRKLQRYTVSLPPHEFQTMRDRRDIEEMLPGFWVVRSVAQYSGALGLLVDGGALEASKLVG